MQPVRIAVAGATGNIGALTVAALRNAGHQVVRISRSLGVDLTNGDGLDAALTHADAVVDTTNCTATGRDEAVAYFGATTRNLLAAEQRAGVHHHVLLSIVGVDPVDMARRTDARRGRAVELVPTWSSLFGTEMAGDVLLPEASARIAPTTFNEWLTGSDGLTPPSPEHLGPGTDAVDCSAVTACSCGSCRAAGARHAQAFSVRWCPDVRAAAPSGQDRRGGGANSSIGGVTLAFGRSNAPTDDRRARWPRTRRPRRTRRWCPARRRAARAWSR